MKYAYYPGCSLHSVAKEYDKSVKVSLKGLGVELEEIPDWLCCGASSGHSVDHLAGLAIPAKTFIWPEEQGLDILAPCAACWQRLAWVNYTVKNEPVTAAKINKVIGAELKGTSNVVTVMEAIASVGYDKIAEAVKKPLKGLKIACYYGCYYVKPQKVAHVDDSENPMMLDKIMEAIGAEPVNWPYKTECCGASAAFYEPDVVLKLGKDIIEMAQKAGAEAIVTACPLCQPNLDGRQGQINRRYGTKLSFPIYYVSELVAYALGNSIQESGINLHITDAEKLLQKIG